MVDSTRTDHLNLVYYTEKSDAFDHVPFNFLLPDLLRSHLMDQPPTLRLLDIGSGPGALAAWLTQEFPQSSIECLDPCPRMVEMCQQKGLLVHQCSIQAFDPGRPPPCYDVILAISSLIHVPRHVLFGTVWQTIANLLVPGGLLCLSVIIGGDDGVADPDGSGLPRYFTRIKDPSEVVSALADLGLQVVDSHLVPVPRMACEFYLAFFQKPKT